MRAFPFTPMRRKSSAQLRARAGDAGFTLLEMLVVLVIIGLLAGLVGSNLLARVDAANIVAANTQARILRDSIDSYRLDVGRFPTKEEGLEVLNSPPKDERLARRWRGPYLREEIPLDPWGNAYVYAPENSTIALYSLGADGEPGGDGNNADVGILPKTVAQP